MTKFLSKKRVAVDDTGSDDGFVEDAPRSKKSKVTNTGSADLKETHEDEEGNKYWLISSLRRVQVSEFKGTTMIGIREFYEKDGKSLPGKKGISLSLDQYNTLLQILPAIEAALIERGLSVQRPSYEPADKETDQDDETKSGDDQPVKLKAKANHEATSDEEED